MSAVYFLIEIFPLLFRATEIKLMLISLYFTLNTGEDVCFITWNDSLPGSLGEASYRTLTRYCCTMQEILNVVFTIQ